MKSLVLSVCAAALIVLSWSTAAGPSARAGFHVCGDPNNDGIVNSLDALLVLQVNAGLETLPAPAVGSADVNNDSMVNATDALLILQSDAGLIGDLNACFKP